MTQTLRIRGKRLCRGCKVQKTPINYGRLPNGVHNPFCLPCVKRKRRETLDKLNAKRVKASWEVSQ